MSAAAGLEGTDVKGSTTGRAAIRRRGRFLGGSALGLLALAALPAPFLFVCACSCGTIAAPLSLPEVPFMPLVVIAGAGVAMLALRRARARDHADGGAAAATARALRRVQRFASRVGAVFFVVAVISIAIGAAAAAYASARPEPVTAFTPACDCTGSGVQGIGTGSGSGSTGDAPGDADGDRDGDAVDSGVDALSVPSVGSGEELPLAVALIAGGATLVTTSHFLRRRGTVASRP